MNLIQEWMNGIHSFNNPRAEARDIVRHSQMGQSLVSLLHCRRVMWSPLEKAVQGIIEGSTRASFTTMRAFFQFSMLNLDPIMDVI